MDIFGILDPDPHKNVCGYETLDYEDVNTKLTGTGTKASFRQYLELPGTGNT